jgi:uncharacterized protein YndB with AHSA1/START domain
MKYRLWTSLLAAAVMLSSPAKSQERANRSAMEKGSARAVRVETTVKAPVSEVWRVWTTSQGAQEFFAQKANILLAIGGPYEIQFDPKDERSGTKGLKILSYLPEEMISFQWNAPPEMPEVRNGGTWVVVEMRPESADRTHVTVTHLGFKAGEEWDRAYVHFERGWGDLLKRLERRFTDGPIDWNKERMIYQESETTAVTIALAHIDAWSRHDWDKTRELLAPNVHATVNGGEFTGSDNYMALKIKGAQLVDPGSVRVLSTIGDENNALILVTLRIALGPGGTMVTMARSCRYLLDENKKIKEERDEFFLLSR